VTPSLSVTRSLSAEQGQEADEATEQGQEADEPPGEPEVDDVPALALATLGEGQRHRPERQRRADRQELRQVRRRPQRLVQCPPASPVHSRFGKTSKKPGYCSYGLIEQCFVGIFTLLVSSTCLNSLATSHIFVLGSPPFGFIILSLLAGASASAMVDG
jgi:hypothetical protein